MRFIFLWSSLHLLLAVFFLHLGLNIHDPKLPHQRAALLLLLDSVPFCITENHTYSFTSSFQHFGPLDCEVLATITYMCPNLTHVLRGAHVCVGNDQGLYYTWITRLEGAYPRLSSHASLFPVYGVPILNNEHSILGGVSLGNDTWFQLEKYQWSLTNPRKSFLHALDFIYYILMDRQVGPYGTSSFTDRRPLRQLPPNHHTWRFRYNVSECM